MKLLVIFLFLIQSAYSEVLTPEGAARLVDLPLYLDIPIYGKDDITPEDDTNDTNELPATLDRRHCDNPAISQIGGTCTAHGVSNAIDNTACNGQDTSNEDLWSKYRVFNTYSALVAATKNRLCEESDWPNGRRRNASCTKNAHIKLTSFRQLPRSVSEVKKSLNNGMSVVYSGRVTISWLNCHTFMYPWSKVKAGSHAVAIVGYKDDESVVGGGYFLTLGSWGTYCGENGYQYLPYNYLHRRDREMHVALYEITAVDSTYPDIDEEEQPSQPTNCRRVRTCRIPSLRYRCGPWRTVCD